jgi:DNA-binding response OmpR family regulator
LFKDRRSYNINKIMVVDDEAGIATGLERYLKQIGCQVIKAHYCPYNEYLKAILKEK